MKRILSAVIIASFMALLLSGCSYRIDDYEISIDKPTIEDTFNAAADIITDAKAEQESQYYSTEETDYSDSASWWMNDYNNPQKKDAKADVIWFMGSSITTACQENGVGAITDDVADTYEVLYNGGVTAFDNNTRMYIPFYRQIASELATACTEHNDLIDQMKSSEVKDDIFASLDYYFLNFNDGRPFIIGGQSQGGAAVQIALEEYFGQESNKKYLNQMVAAYSVAYGVDRNWLHTLPYIDFANGSDDTGVLVSWNTEGPGEKGKNFLLAENTQDTLVINPINWKTDDTYAKAEECPSSLVNKELVTPGQYNLQIDPARGSVICDNCENYVQTETPDGTLWGGKSLHTEELALAYGSIHQNVIERIDAFLAKKNGTAIASLDYSDPDNWNKNEYNNADKKDTAVDVFWIYGTCITEPSHENGTTDITDELRSFVDQMYYGGAEAFDDGTRFYTPYYRQIALATSMEGTTHENLPNLIKTTEAGADIYGALDYYFENYNEDRPFILAGYSQGGACVQYALENYFTKPEHKFYLNRMVAAYSIAYGVDKNWLEDLEYNFAEGVDDFGVVISWNTEGPDPEGDSFLLANNTEDTLVINPINWKRDETYAKAEECLGSYVDGEIVSPGIYNMQLDLNRGVVIVDNNPNYAPGVFGGKSLHTYEISGAFLSIRQNMHDRIDAFFNK